MNYWGCASSSLRENRCASSAWSVESRHQAANVADRSCRIRGEGTKLVSRELPSLCEPCHRSKAQIELRGCRCDKALTIRP